MQDRAAPGPKRIGLSQRRHGQPQKRAEDGQRKGRALAAECRRRHEIVVQFLIRLGLDAETAERDAEGIEHHVSDRTLALFRDFAQGG
jgi:hypothetical protein